MGCALRGSSVIRLLFFWLKGVLPRSLRTIPPFGWRLINPSEWIAIPRINLLNGYEKTNLEGRWSLSEEEARKLREEAAGRASL